MERWMRVLAEAYAACRATHPEDRALVVFDIGGTLLDEGAVAGDPPGDGCPRADVLAAHRPYRGMLDVARWFDAQPMTSVAVNSARPERDRPALRRCLDVLGREYRLDIRDDLLHLRAGERGEDPVADKLAALRRWRDQGFRIVAVVDSDPRMAAGLAAEPTLASTVSLTTESLLGARRRPEARGGLGGAGGQGGAGGAGHVELVWHRVNDPIRLRQFLASPVRWGEVDVRRDPDGRIVTRHDEIGDEGTAERDGIPTARAFFEAFGEAGKAVVLDLKDPAVLDATLDLAADAGLAADDLWVNARVDVLGEQGFRDIATRAPAARLQCPVEFLGPMAVALPGHARTVVATLQDWGVDRFSVAWTNPHADAVLDRLDAWDAEVNLYAVSDLPQFLSAVLQLPASITADFTLPEWHYFGRGAGNDGRFHQDPGQAAVSPGVDMP